MANNTGKKTKGSGRKKGTPNKRTIDAQKLAEEIGCDPLEVLLRATAGDWKFFGFKEKSLKIGKAVVRDHITMEDRVSAAKEAAQYIYGKRKQIEHSAPDAEKDTLLGILFGEDGDDDDTEES